VASLDARSILLGVSGGIGAYKAAALARGLVRAGAQVDVVLTRGAARFIGAATFEGITGRACRTEVWDDVPAATHVGLGRDAGLIIVYPATAHTIARLAAGLADDLLTSSVLAATCPVLIAPAMHPEMWTNPATVDNVARLIARGIEFVGPDDGPLMGGDEGIGRLVEPEGALAAVVARLDDRMDLMGRKVLVTAGGTQEPIDPVRFLGNRSSGRMGFALAAMARRRGADVTLVAAPSGLATPPGVERIDVTTAVQMRDAVLARLGATDVVLKAAAVADFRPASASATKIKRSGGTPGIELVANPDIVAEVVAARGSAASPLVVAFAAETDDVLANARTKLRAKGVDLLVANDVSDPRTGFGSASNAVTILRADGDMTVVGLAPKEDVAHAILDAVVAALGRCSHA